jgi:hypothetical protein
VQVIESSPEYHDLVVRFLFGYVLGRSVDESGRATWLNFLDKGGTAEQLEASLLGSEEYFNASVFRRNHANGTNDAFLAGLYGDVLHRMIDPVGLQGRTQALANGTSRSAVAASVLASLESDQMEVQTLYSRFLRRTADSSGLGTFTESLQKGVPNEAIIATLLGSDEYFSVVLRFP